MERSLMTGALFLGVLGWICGLLAARARPGAPSGARAVPSALWIAALAFPALCWLITWPDAPPFGVGHAAGNGILIGGIAALLGAGSLLQFVNNDDADARASGTAALLALAAAVAIVPAIYFKQGRLDALMGVGIGWLATSCILCIGTARAAAAHALAKSAGFIVAVCAALSIGVFRDAMMPGARSNTWSALIAVLAATVPFVVLLAALPAGLAARRVPIPNLFGTAEEDQSVAATRGWQLVLASVLFLLVAQLLAVKVADKPALLFCAAVGVFAGAIAWRVVADAGRQNVIPVLAPLILLAGFIVSFRLMQGFGGGVMLIGAWIAGALAEAGGRRQEAADEWQESVELPRATHHSSLITLLFFGAAAMLYRLAATRFRIEIDTLELDEHFAFFGLLVGATLPPFVARLVAARDELSSSNLMLRLVLCGAIVAAAPLFAIMLWGAKAALVLTAGAALGLLLTPQENRWPHMAGFFALGGALLVAEWTKRALPLYEISRDDKARVLGIVTLVLIVLLLAVDFASRARRKAVAKEVA